MVRCHPECAFALGHTWSGCVLCAIRLGENSCKVHEIVMGNELNGNISSNRVKGERSDGMVCQRDGREVSMRELGDFIVIGPFFNEAI